MCVIFYGKAEHIVDLPLNQAWSSNHDGAGLCWFDGQTGKWSMVKGLMKLKDLWGALNELPRSAVDVALHLRLATHGAATPENTHPFVVGDPKDGCFLMHNGVISGLGSSGATGHSDSAHLAKILGYLPHEERHTVLNMTHGKFLYLTPGKYTTFGDFTKIDNEVLASNTFYSSRTWNNKGTARNYGSSYSRNYSIRTSDDPIFPRQEPEIPSYYNNPLRRWVYADETLDDIIAEAEHENKTNPYCNVKEAINKHKAFLRSEGGMLKTIIAIHQARTNVRDEDGDIIPPTPSYPAPLPTPAPPPEVPAQVQASPEQVEISEVLVETRDHTAGRGWPGEMSDAEVLDALPGESEAFCEAQVSPAENSSRVVE